MSLEGYDPALLLVTFLLPKLPRCKQTTLNIPSSRDLPTPAPQLPHHDELYPSKIIQTNMLLRSHFLTTSSYGRRAHKPHELSFIKAQSLFVRVFHH